MKSRRAVWIVLAVVGVLAIAFLAGSPNQQGTPYAPTSSDPSGTKALVELLGKLGANVAVTDDQPPPSADIAIGFPNTIPDERDDALRSWVAAGHTLVIADTNNQLSPPQDVNDQPPTDLTDETVQQGECTVAAVGGARTLSVTTDADVGVATGAFFPIPAGASGCYTERTSPFGQPAQGDLVAVLVVQPVGRGQIVSMGLPAAFTNAHLDEADNSVLAAALLAPRTGTSVAVLQLPPGTVGRVTLSSLVSIGVKLALLQVVLALIVYLFFRGRRLGKPITESQPVQIPGSELVSAVGNLLQQTKSPERAAVIMRRDLRARLGDRLGLPAATSPEVLAATVEARVGIPQDDVLPVVADLPCPTDADLLTLSAQVDDLRRRVLGTRS
jgi:hypothetical protein